MDTTVTSLPDVRRLLVVCAHPYDVTFTMGATIGAFTDAGTSVDVLCLTHGRRPDEGPVRRLARARDLGDAARALGVREVTFLEHHPGELAGTPLERLTDGIVVAADAADALLIVDALDPGSHPDHVRTMRAACRAARLLNDPLYGWALNPPPGNNRTLAVAVDRERQDAAIACHRDLPAEDPIRERATHRGPREYLTTLLPERTRGPEGPRERVTRV